MRIRTINVMQSSVFLIIMYLLGLICAALAYQIYAKTMQAELYREGYRVGNEIISTSLVASRMQCLHRCGQKEGCQGMNVKTTQSNGMTCELTSAHVSEANDDQLLVKGGDWEFHRVITLARYNIKVMSYGQKDTGEVGDCYISVNGRMFNMQHKPGFLVLAFDFEKGLSHSIQHWFNPGVPLEEAKARLQEIPDGYVVVVGVRDTATDNSKIGTQAINLLTGFGAKEAGNIAYRMPYCLITRTGFSVPWKKEVLKNMNTGPSICEVVI